LLVFSTIVFLLQVLSYYQVPQNVDPNSNN